MDATTFTPTEEQRAIIRHIEEDEENLIINALAGTGKTSTLGLVQQASIKRPILCLAFNKSIATEMQGRFPDDVSAQTLNSLGHRIWGRMATGKIAVDRNKVGNLLRERIWELRQRTLPTMPAVHVVSIAMAKARGYVPGGKFQTPSV
jgi:hypothetical protein